MKTQTIDNQILELSKQLSKDFIDKRSKLATQDTNVKKATKSRSEIGLTLIQTTVKEIITHRAILKKQYVEITNEKCYSLIRKAMLLSQSRDYYIKIISLSFRYLESGYTLDISKLSVDLVQRLVTSKPSRNKVKDVDRPTLMKVLEAREHQIETERKASIKKHLPANLLKLLKGLKGDDYNRLKEYMIGSDTPKRSKEYKTYKPTIKD